MKNPTRERIMRNLVHNDGVYKVLPFTAFFFWELTHPFWTQRLSLYSHPTKRGKYPLAASKNGSINPTNRKGFVWLRIVL